MMSHHERRDERQSRVKWVAPYVRKRGGRGYSSRLSMVSAIAECAIAG